jgi:iron complex outermembrane receptor protein
VRNPATGQINSWTGFLDNIGEIETSGYDLRVNWKAEVEGGSVAANFQLTHVIDYSAVDKFGGVYSRSVGVEENDGSIPRNVANMTVTYELGDWTYGLTNRYTSSLVELCGVGGQFVGEGICSDEGTGTFGQNSIKSMVFTDAQIAWNQAFSVTGLLLKLGINNLLDKDPPACLTCSLNGYDASTYDLQGQYYYVQMAYRPN